MQKTFLVFKNDLKLIFRDPAMAVIFIIPIILVLFCRFAIPVFANYLPAISEYYWLIVAALTSISASTPSFLVGFILLDERDENIHTMIKILPLAPNFILKCRILFMVISSYIFSFFILMFNGIFSVSVFYNLFISLLFSLIPPILTFSIVTIAKNKIEAATLYKGLSMVLFLPVAAFFIQTEWRFAFGILPFYWTFNAFQFIDDIYKFLMNFFTGLIVHFVFITIFYRLFKKKAV